MNLSNKPIKRGIATGTFDLFHAGHVLFLKECRKYCDELFVAIQVNPNLERKDKGKPVQSVLERSIQVRGSKYVTTTLCYETELDLAVILSNFDIDIRFLGGDYIPVENEGGFSSQKVITGEELVPIKYIERNHPYSSTELRERVKKS